MSNVNHRILETVDLHVPGYLGASDPLNIGAGKYWIDTTLGTGQWVLKIRNATNTGWESAALSLAIHSLAGKTSLAANDVLLIEDSATAYSYKKVTYANLVSNLGSYKVKGTEANTAAYLEQYVDGSSVSFGPTLLQNPSFELWDAGWSSDVNIPNPPTSWAIIGTGALISREEDISHGCGYYSAKLSRVGADCYLYQTVVGGTAWQNKVVTYRQWVYALAGDNTGVYLQVNDGVAVTASDPHSDLGGWEQLTVTHTCSSTATTLIVYAVVYTRNQSIYLDDGVLIDTTATDINSSKLQVSSQHLTRLEREYRATHVKKLMEPTNMLSWGACIMEDDTVRIWGSTIWNGMGVYDAANCVPTKYAFPADYRQATHGVPISLHGGYHNFIVLTSGGYVYIAGHNGEGQLAIGDVTRRYVSSYVRVAGGAILTNVVKVVSGNGGDDDNINYAAITSTGQLYIWGYNGHGQHGQGDTVARNYADLIAPQGGATGWTDVAIGGDGACHIVALTNNGKVFTWGYNASYQLGTGDATGRTSPFNTGLTGITKVWAAGDCSQANSFALKSTGVLYGWGDNRYGALGLGHASQVAVPTVGSMAAAGLTVTDLYVSRCYYIATGAKYSDGSLRVAGYNGYYQLGTGDATQRNTAYYGGIDHFTKMCWMPGSSQGNQMVLRDGILYTCGHSPQGQTGTGLTGNIATLTPVIGFEPYQIVDVSAFGTAAVTYMMVLDSDGNAYTCGDNGLGQLGHSLYDVSPKCVLTKIRF